MRVINMFINADMEKREEGAEKQYGGMGESIQYKFETNYVSFLK